MKLFRRLSAVTLGWAIGLVTLGTVVRVTDSGLGCPDWPRCFGRFVPPMEASALIEYSHRLAASIMGLLILGLATVAWLKLRDRPTIFFGTLGALIVVGIQGWIGRQVVLDELPRNLVLVHFLTAMTIIGLLSLVTTSSYSATRFPKGGRLRGLALLSASTLLFTAIAMVLGAAYAQLSGPLILVHMGAVAVAAIFVAATVSVAVRSEHRVVRVLASVLGVAFFAQMLLGLQTLLTEGTAGQAPYVAIHVFGATSVWAAAVGLVVLAFRSKAGDSPVPVAGGERQSQTVGGSVKAYFLLTKPRIIELLLITTVPAMVVAARGWPSTWLVVWTVMGGALAAGGANAINSFVDRDIDDRMERTRSRPLPRRKVLPRRALAFGVFLGIISFALLAYTTNLLAASLAASGILFYVFVYTLWLKRRTPSNIVIGGAAGAVPPLVGWAAVTGELALAPLVIFAIIFYWTPPHFWALALRYSDDYANAGVPMLPVVRGPQETGRQIFWYSVVLLAVSLLLSPAAGLGSLYLLSAVVLGSAFILYAVKLQSDPSPEMAMKLFRYSITYLVLLFVAMALDAAMGSPVLAPQTSVFVVAAPLFLGAQAMVMFSVIGDEGGEKLAADGPLSTEIAWTAIPSLLVAALFVAAWQALLS